MAVVAIVPAWMLADGEYVGLGVGEQVTTGLALAVTGTSASASAEPADPPGLRQAGEQPGFTTARGRVECPHDGDGVRAGTVLCAGTWAVVPFAATPLRPGEDVVVSGWLTAEPYLWAADGVLARAVPAGRADWRVARVSCVVDGADPAEIGRLPDEATVDPDAAYLLELVPAD
ncbi:hypothetical protein [Actinomycetospora sp. TBRC 11914]|uniref:hypothetical protein n=1 Tax=Actinomycetospora sp. TBRC 11914 TaxID=2729387 RepID=UPI00145C444D|nr:hypothetical protein [Actinomycetospora sp. TBRC 11914]NMO93761.1 hypothetical protein [Actinomycetospora sp. TBRC 11914]